LPKLARVENFTESASLGDIADPFRPKYAVGVQLLGGDGEDSKGTPRYPAVPLPVTMGGDESGFMQYPPPGTLVELAFQDGRQDKPFIRQVLPANSSLPAIKPGEQLQQQRAGVFQRVTVQGDWHRETDQTIREVSAARTVEADKETRKVIDREITVQADDSKTVLGTARTTAGAVTHIARGDYTVGTSASLKTAARAADEKIVEGKTVDIGGALTERIAGVRQSVSAALQLQAATTSIGTAETNILTLLIDTLDLIDSL
ncbi:protein phage, partial [Klebsiella aerogenes]